MESKKWYVKWPGSFHISGPYRFENGPISDREFRTWLRRGESGKRLPRGLEIWTERGRE